MLSLSLCVTFKHDMVTSSTTEMQASRTTHSKGPCIILTYILQLTKPPPQLSSSDPALSLHFVIKQVEVVKQAVWYMGEGDYEPRNSMSESPCAVTYERPVKFLETLSSHLWNGRDGEMLCIKYLAALSTCSYSSHTNISYYTAYNMCLHQSLW